MNRLIKEINSHKFDQNIDVLCILATRLHETPKGRNAYTHTGFLRVLSKVMSLGLV